MNVNVRDLAAERAAQANRRAQWMRQLRQWHWISGAVSLVSMLLFSVTGITLNHSAAIEAKPQVTTQEGTLAAPLVEALAGEPRSGRASVPASVAEAVRSAIGIDVAGREAEWSESEAYIALPRPGGDAWVSIDRETGAVTYERTDRGWISYLNDLHKGRHTGPSWSLFIDVFAAASIVFCITGLLLLQMYAKGRSLTWPLVGLGFGIPVLLAMFLIH
ncbi:PepSY-associated TM helix domain-containing protein [Hyphomicrobium sp.]|uniref:PepSY-associated TM helix domain-containing protein n=1 Tax=Hyphomicrobium sp. TaxID=82 RepID=UPI0025C351BC|nr:PepSY-associated TM helix domain-containing protein [Hyphomicrobium sp.]MCC7253583.1 PepSY-associated TM helix domain-containing protein [Hyphomicrobium sp.]